jgi:hypothetical protein
MGPSIKYSIAFYADTPRGEKNKLFFFKIPSEKIAKRRLKYFKNKGFLIRAAWLLPGNIRLA